MAFSSATCSYGEINTSSISADTYVLLASCLPASGRWTPAQPSTRDDGFIKAISITEVPRLKRVGGKFYHRLWPEHIKLAVDGDLCEVPHISALNPALVKKRFYPHLDRNHTLPFYLSHPTIRFVRNNLDQTRPPFHTHRTLVYIPTFPRYLDAVISRYLEACTSKSLLRCGIPGTIHFSGSNRIEYDSIFLSRGGPESKATPDAI
jgi:hypothetical protein